MTTQDEMDLPLYGLCEDVNPLGKPSERHRRRGVGTYAYLHDTHAFSVLVSIAAKKGYSQEQGDHLRVPDLGASSAALGEPREGKGIHVSGLRRTGRTGATIELRSCTPATPRYSMAGRFHSHCGSVAVASFPSHVKVKRTSDNGLFPGLSSGDRICLLEREYGGRRQCLVHRG